MQSHGLPGKIPTSFTTGHSNNLQSSTINFLLYQLANHSSRTSSTTLPSTSMMMTLLMRWSRLWTMLHLLDQLLLSTITTLNLLSRLMMMKLVKLSVTWDGVSEHQPKLCQKIILTIFHQLNYPGARTCDLEILKYFQRWKFTSRMFWKFLMKILLQNHPTLNFCPTSKLQFEQI